MSTLIEAVIGLIVLINHLSCGTTFVGIWNRRWHWLRVAAQCAGGKSSTTSLSQATWLEHKHMPLKQKGKAWNYQKLCEEEHHSLNGCDPLFEWELFFFFFSLRQISVRNWTVVFTKVCSLLTEGTQLWQQWDWTNTISTKSTNRFNVCTQLLIICCINTQNY